MRKLMFASLLAVAAALGGCASLVSDSSASDAGATVDSDAGAVGTGSIIASVTTNGPNEALFTLRRFGESGTKALSSRASALLDAPTFRSGREHGRIHVLTLPAGRYELIGWSLRLGRQIQHRRWLSPAGLPPIEFNLRPGEAVYLGNLHVEVSHDDGALGLPDDLRPVRDATARLSPMAERDLALAAELQPGVRDQPLRPVVRPPQAWSLTVRRPEG